MRVLHAISSIDPKAGGPAAAIVGLASAQAQAGLEVSVLATFCAGSDTTPQKQLAAAEVVVRLVGPSTGALARHPEIVPACREMVAAADIVHIHALWEEIQHQAATAARAANKPYIMRPCGMLDPWSLSQSKWKKRLYMAWRLRRDLNGAAALHFTAELERDLTAPLRLKAPAIVGPNGIDLSEFGQLPPKGTFRSRYPQFAGRPMLLFLSRIHPKKGLDILIPAFAACLKQLSGRELPFLVVAGPDSDGYQAKVMQIAREHEVSDHVVFPGPLFGKDKVAAYADADLFVLPSYQENFGIVVVEALAAGCPVVISDQVNIYREIVASEVGVAVPLVSTRFTEAIVSLLTRPLAGMASRARSLVFSSYDWNQVAAKWVVHYRAIRDTHDGTCNSK